MRRRRAGAVTEKVTPPTLAERQEALKQIKDGLDLDNLDADNQQRLDAAKAAVAEAAPETPKRNASKTIWTDYAEFHGKSVDGLTRDEIADLFLGPKP